MNEKNIENFVDLFLADTKLLGLEYRDREWSNRIWARMSYLMISKMVWNFVVIRIWNCFFRSA